VIGEFVVFMAFGLALVLSGELNKLLGVDTSSGWTMIAIGSGLLCYVKVMKNKISDKAVLKIER
jgi:5-methylthioribose kinase